MLARAVVVIVSVVSTAPAPGASDAGANPHAVPTGRFAHDRFTAFVKAPPCAESVTRYVAACPAATVADAGEAPTPKLVTVIWRGVGSENDTPLLLAETLTLDVPNGHASDAAGDEPQPPVQLNRVNGH